jgi:hypothetical protein
MMNTLATDTMADRHAWAGEMTIDRGKKDGFPCIYKSTKHNKAMEEFVDLSNGYVFMRQPDPESEEQYPRFFHFDSVYDASDFIESQDKPRFSSVLLKGKEVRLSLELDMENFKLDNLQFDKKTKDELDEIMVVNPDKKYWVYALHSIFTIKQAMYKLLQEEYSIKNPEWLFVEATDHRQEKKSIRFYGALKFPN